MAPAKRNGGPLAKFAKVERSTEKVDRKKAMAGKGAMKNGDLLKGSAKSKQSPGKKKVVEVEVHDEEHDEMAGEEEFDMSGDDLEMSEDEEELDVEPRSKKGFTDENRKWLKAKLLDSDGEDGSDVSLEAESFSGIKLACREMLSEMCMYTVVCTLNAIWFTCE